MTEFLYHCAEATGMLRVTVPMASGGGAESTSGRHAPQQPATLFSNGHVRADVAVQVSGGCQIIPSMFACRLLGLYSHYADFSLSFLATNMQSRYH